MTINEIASAIRNNLGNGLKETPNHSYSIEQLREEVSNERNLIILEQSKKRMFNMQYFVQKMDNIELEMSTFPNGGYSASFGSVPMIRIPKLAMTVNGTAIEYIGPSDMAKTFKVYTDHSFNTHKYSRVISKLPYVYVDLAHEADGYIPVYFFNLNNTGLKYVSVRAVFADCVGILDLDGLFGEDEEFPAPASVQEQIIDRITNKWVRWYKQLNHPTETNTQTDKN